MITIMFSFYFIQRLTVVYYYISRRTRNLYELGSDPLYIFIQWNMFISSLTFLLRIHFVNTSDYDSVSFHSVLLYTIENFYHSWNLFDGLAKYWHVLIIFLYSKRTQNGRLFWNRFLFNLPILYAYATH